MSACFLAVIWASAAWAEPPFVPTKTDPDPPGREPPTTVAPAAPSWDLDGVYLWLGPTGAASYAAPIGSVARMGPGRLDATWDSTFGGHLAVIRVREHEPLGAIGAAVGASRWTVRGGARIWLDALVGTRIGRMIGLSAGPILELPELAHAQVGGSIGLWAFVGVAPFVRVGAVRELGNFVEIGVHIALPVLRR